MKLEEAISEVEAAGFYWAICRSEDGYQAVVEKPPAYFIGDDLHGPGCSFGATPAEALMDALKNAR